MFAFIAPLKRKSGNVAKATLAGTNKTILKYSTFLAITKCAKKWDMIGWVGGCHFCVFVVLLKDYRLYLGILIGPTLASVSNCLGSLFIRTVGSINLLLKAKHNLSNNSKKVLLFLVRMGLNPMFIIIKTSSFSVSLQYIFFPVY